MQFFYDSAVTLPIIWYFVPDDRETLPFATVFGSRIYERGEEPQEPIGELYKPVPWRGGQAPGPVPKCGKCGNADAWERGVSIDAPFPAVFDGTNIPICCCPPDPQFFGGAAIGGLIGAPFAGEAASGGVLGEPFKGEAASGGVAAIVLPFTGEAASGGRIVEPFAGEAASGGTFDIGEPFIGGIASGGEFSVGLVSAGGAASGGSFVFTPASAGPCETGGTHPSPLVARWVWEGDNCGGLDGREETLTTTSCFDGGDYTAWVEGPTFTFEGFDMRTLIACNNVLHVPIFWLVDTACTFAWVGPYEVIVDSTSPLSMHVTFDLGDFCGDTSTYTVTFSET